MMRRVFALLLLTLPFAPARRPRNAAATFNAFVRRDVARGRGAGVSRAVIDQAFAGVSQDQGVLSFDRRQRGTFRKTSRNTQRRESGGRISRAPAAPCSATRRSGRASSRQFGVPGNLLVAIWGLETDFGTGDMGKLAGHRVVTTMAHDCRRTELFQGELLRRCASCSAATCRCATLIGLMRGEIGQTQFCRRLHQVRCRL